MECVSGTMKLEKEKIKSYIYVSVIKNKKYLAVIKKKIHFEITIKKNILHNHHIYSDKQTHTHTWALFVM